MEQSVASIEHSIAISWRTAALLVAAVAAVELVLLLAAGIALLDRSTSHSAKAAAPPKAKAHATRPTAPPAKAKRHPRKRHAQPKPLVARAKMPVLVLNGNGLTGAAGTEAAVVRGRGYPVSSVGNARHTDHGPSMVMYRPGFRAEAARLAHDVAVKIVAPLDGLKATDLGPAKLVVVVGRD